MVFGEGHEHRDCAPELREWLDAEERQPATVRRHPHCVECGTVRYLGSDRARAVGFYHNALASLDRFLQHDRLYGKLPEVHVRLISTELERTPEFHDTYDVRRASQLERFIVAVRKYRPDLPEEFLRGFLLHGPPIAGVPDEPPDTRLLRRKV